MAFQISPVEREVGGQRVTVHRLSSSDGSAGAEVWSSHGFNCLRWWVTEDGSPGELLFVRSDWETDPVPTRSGVPVLFPFPNRIRDGRFSFEGKEYSLPVNDPAKANAIHGFTPRKPWRVVGTQADEEGAEVTGEFTLSVDAPEALPLWPGDCSLRLTCRLEDARLVFIATVTNLATVDVPFGLGLHPYFRLPTATEGIADYHLEAPVGFEWELKENLPTGRKVSPTPDPKPGLVVGEHVFDHLYGDLPAGANLEELRAVGRLSHEQAGSIELWADASFRELILFTPPHRLSVALEPYTCATDAANLATDDDSAGWRILRTGQTWTGRVEFRRQPGKR